MCFVNLKLNYFNSNQLPMLSENMAVSTNSEQKVNLMVSLFFNNFIKWLIINN